MYYLYNHEHFIGGNDKKPSKYQSVYGDNIPELPDKHIYKLLLKHFHDFARENGLSYVIAFGTLLGQVRNMDFIPYDYDIDVIIGRSDIDKLFKLAKKKTTYLNIIYNNQLAKNPLTYTGKPVIILNGRHPYENKGQRYSCKGVKVKRPTDGCSFKGLVGRLVYMDNNGKSFYLDLFAHFGFRQEFGNTHSPNCVDLDIPIVPCKLAGLDTFCPESKLSHQLLRKKYGRNYMRPDHRYNHKSKKWDKI